MTVTATGNARSAFEAPMMVSVIDATAPENQTASSLGGITAMETLLPALFHLLLAMAIRFCKLNNPMMSRIASDLRQRHVQP